jgi:DNA polymerase-1
MWPVDAVPEDAGEALLRPYRAVLAGRGRFARNAVIQGSAAELFKAWTATVRARLATEDLGTVVLCLHDELLLHVRADAADRVARDVVTDLEATAARWSRSGVRFVTDVTVVDRWSDAKG